MKPKIESFVHGLVLAPLAPTAGLLGSWWISFALLPERWIPLCAISGLALGILADIYLLKKMIPRADQFGMIFWIVIFIFYHVGVFGFFMGLQVLNAALAIPAGFIVGGKLTRKKAEQSQIRTTRFCTCIFTSAVLFFVFAASAILALREATLPAELEGMLALPFTVTWSMIWGIILVGGAGLLTINWLLTGLAVRLTHRFLSTP